MIKTLLTMIVSAICIIGLNYINAKHGIDGVIIVERPDNVTVKIEA